jgi:hypothetical protein
MIMRENHGSSGVGSFILILTMIFLTMISSSSPYSVTSEASASPSAPLWMDLDIEFHGPDEGKLMFTLKTSKNIQFRDSELREPDGLDLVDNDNLERVMKVLIYRFDGPQELFRSFLDTDGRLELTDVVYKINTTDTGIGFRFSCDFSVLNKDGKVEYYLLPFLRSITVPVAYSNDIISISQRDQVISEMKQIRIDVLIEPGPGLNMDLQSEVPGHDRGTSREKIEFSSDIFDLRTGGNKMLVTSNFFFSSATLLLITIVVLLVLIGAFIIIWYRNRFRSWGLILPVLTILSLFLPVAFFINPNINIYGTFDSFLIGSWLLCGLLVAGCYFINPRIDKKEFSSYEEEKGPSFEMPEVVYMEKPVYFTTKDKDSGIDPYDILGVTRTMDTDQVKEAYKKEILKYHPDKLHGAPDNFKDLAMKETERLNQAYDMIMKERGFKDR